MATTTIDTRRSGGRIMGPINSFVERFIPSPLVFALVLTLAAMVLALAMTPAGPVEVLTSWGGGLAGLLEFMGQMALMLLFGGMVASTKIVKRGLRALASIPKGRVMPYVFVTFITLALTMVNWAVALVAAALLSREIASISKTRGQPVHFPLLIAGSYMVMLTSQMAPFGAIPLFAATSGSFVEEQLGHTVPLSETSLSAFNIVAIVLIIIAVCVTIALMAPKKGDSIDPIGDVELNPVETKYEIHTPADRLDASRLITLIPGVLLLGYVAVYFSTGGGVDLNIVNWMLLAAVLCFASNPFEITDLARESVSNVRDILLQFPIYAGIAGIIAGTGLGEVISQMFIQISTAETYPFLTFVSASIMNFFIPSGGGQFAVQGPIMLEAGAALGVNHGLTIMAFSYGDQLTNMIQPFWALPLLAMAGLKLRTILGYTIMVMLVAGSVFAALLLWAGFAG